VNRDGGGLNGFEGMPPESAGVWVEVDDVRAGDRLWASGGFREVASVRRTLHTVYLAFEPHGWASTVPRALVFREASRKAGGA